MFNKYPKLVTIVTWCLIGAALLASLSVVYRRIQLERQDQRVETVLNYKDVVQLAQLSGQSTTDLLTKIKNSNSIVSILIEEDSLENFEEQGQVTVLKGSDIINSYRIGHANNFVLNYIYKQVNVNPNNFYIVVEQTATFERIRDFLTAELGKTAVIPIGNQKVLEVINTKDDLYEIGMGVDRDQIRMLEEMGFSVVLSLKSIRRNLDDTIKFKLQYVEALPSVKTIVFSGDMVLGYPQHMELVEKKIVQHNKHIGKIEFSEQLGETAIGIKIPERIIQVHTISEDEMVAINPDKALRRYLRAVKERRVNMLYIRPFLNYSQHEGDISGFNLNFFDVLSSYLKQYGYSVNQISRLYIHTYTPATPVEILFMSIGVFWMCLTLFIAYIPLTIRQKVIMWCSFAVAYYVISQWIGQNFWRQLMALSVAVAVPTYAITSQFPRKINPETPSSYRVIDAVMYLLKVTVMTVCGGLLVTGLLSDLPYLFKTQQFIGVKLAFIIPMVLIGIYFFIKPHRVAAMLYVFRRILDAPIRTSSLLAVIFCGAFMFVYILRTGNYIPIHVPGYETFFRELLEDFLYVRPRTKEFLIGYPVLMLSYLYADRYISRDWLWFFATIGSVGIISVMNSFCHLHTPVLVTVYRTGLGLVLGIMVGLLIWLGISLLKWIVKRVEK